MLVITNRLPVSPEHAEEFETVFTASMRDTLGGVPGLHCSTLQRPELRGCRTCRRSSSTRARRSWRR